MTALAPARESAVVLVEHREGDQEVREEEAVAAVAREPLPDVDAVRVLEGVPPGLDGDPDLRERAEVRVMPFRRPGGS